MNIFLSTKKNYDIQSYKYIQKYYINQEYRKCEDIPGCNYNTIHYYMLRHMKNSIHVDQMWKVYYFCGHNMYQDIKNIKTYEFRGFARDCFEGAFYNSDIRLIKFLIKQCITVYRSPYVLEAAIFSTKLPLMKLMRSNPIYEFFSRYRSSIPKYICKAFFGKPICEMVRHVFKFDRRLQFTD